MTAGDWLVGLCTLALAVVTAVMAWFTRRAAEAGEAAIKDARASIELAREQVQAAREEAEATRALAMEQRLDRELAVRPVIHVHAVDDDLIFAGVAVSNIGHGPAVGLRAFIWPNASANEWYSSSAHGIAAGGISGLSRGRTHPVGWTSRARVVQERCFETFPRPGPSAAVAVAARTLEAHRSTMMLERAVGMTDIYNLVTSPDEHAGDVTELRTCHQQLDAAVATAYGWEDLDITLGLHPTERFGARGTLQPESQREVERRLLELNGERHSRS